MKIWAIADLHGHLPEPPKAADGIDLAIIAGDFCKDYTRILGTAAASQWGWMVEKGEPWLRLFPCPVVLTWGNHDFVGEDPSFVREFVLPKNVHLLNSDADLIAGVRIYGSPWSLCPRGWAFRAEDDYHMSRKLVLVDAKLGLDILVTHGPPPMVGSDGVANYGSAAVHCAALRAGVKLVVTGHVHPARGQYRIAHGTAGGGYVLDYLCANVVHCNNQNEPIHGPMIIEFEPRTREEEA